MNNYYNQNPDKLNCKCKLKNFSIIYKWILYRNKELHFVIYFAKTKQEIDLSL